ncbi:MAG: CHRD domain-containing protein [Actinomycetota bacterium]|nr:CHRD domain-containing protein [Actinomycetota bacterium]
MRKTLTVAGLATLTAGVIALPAAADSDKRALTTKLSGAEEAPGPGDPNGKGHATIRIKGDDTVCFTIVTQRIDGSSAAHIHEAPSGEPGDVVVPLFAGQSDATSRRGCVDDVDPELIEDLREDPSDYYVNVHNADFPAGAVRGQLGD